jgi:hypothetical protein
MVDRQQEAHFDFELIRRAYYKGSTPMCIEQEKRVVPKMWLRPTIAISLFVL